MSANTGPNRAGGGRAIAKPLVGDSEQTYAVNRSNDSMAGFMATLTVRNLEEDLVRRLRVRAAEHGRSAEAEHRAILRAALSETDHAEAAARLAEFRRRTGGRGSVSAADLLKESRAQRMRTLTDPGEGA